jgi:hypothetical protein
MQRHDDLQEDNTGAGEAPPPKEDSSSKGPECAYSVTGFDETSITNIKQESHRFWAHSIVMLVVTLLILKVRVLPPEATASARRPH